MSKQIMPKGGFTKPAFGSEHSTHEHVTSHTKGSKTAAGADKGDHKAFMTNEPNVHFNKPQFGTTGETHDCEPGKGVPGSNTASGNDGDDYEA